ncbi:TRAP dicarboxylate transporter- DctP subunit [Alcanivorax sp. S71-1-4]|jgi:TRAP-type transport system periplasmic protein|uniref:TRAP transporter substrate-binding protein n=1 Tax=Alcanivorax sp. S71-1-4 TaxID=1177159 RepID=UPI00135A2567|nr:TRAP transporter substrate-binding protein [Alcanivorax sp. S71-1-4]KAF0809752.1 TRAP dicarboxylate transporter- DctP subunit [Alcanivorax sp. S71-1-4]
MKKLAILFSTLLCLSFLPLTGQAKTLRLGVITPPSHQWSKGAQAFADEVKARSNGELEVLVFPSGQLGSEAQMLQLLQRGGLDMAFLAAGELANRRPSFAALFAPYIVETPEQARALLQGETATKMLEDVRPLGLVGLGYGMAGLRQIVMRGDVQSVDDLRGRKVRTMPIEPERDFWLKLGAAPTPIPLPALYDAFANGQVDGMQIDFEGSWNTRYIDNAGTVIESNHMMLPMVGVASARVWSSLSDGERDLLSELAAKHLDQILRVYADIDRDYLAKIRDAGVPVLTVHRDFFGPGVDRWYEEWRARAPVLKDLEADAEAIRAADE